MGMGRTTPGSPAGLITLRLPYSTSIPVSGHVAMACPFLMSGGPSRTIYGVTTVFVLLAYDLYAAQYKPRRALYLDLAEPPGG